MSWHVVGGAMIRFVIYLFALTFSTVAMAQAQDRCSDVLSQGIFDYRTLQRNDYFNQLIWSRFYQSSYDQARNDRSFGLGVPVGETVLGGNFNSEAHSSYGSQSEREYFAGITSSQQVNLALMTGNPDIIRAWRDCMQNRAGGGLSARFEISSPTEVTLIVEYFTYGDDSSDRLRESVRLPAGVIPLQNASCLRRGHVFRVGASSGCHIPLRVDDLNLSFTVALRGRTSTTTWLPKRPRLVSEERYYSFPGPILYRDLGNCCSNILISDIVELSASDIKAGWIFDASSASSNLFWQSHAGSSDNNCNSPYFNVDLHRLSYGYRLYAPDRNRRDGKVLCYLTLSVKMKRNFWAFESEDSGEKDLADSDKDLNFYFRPAFD
jgi:hypothetical protein